MLILICKNRSHKKETAMQNVSTLEAANTIRRCANSKGDKVMLRILEICRGINLWREGIKIFDVLTTFYRHGCYRVGVVFDQYREISIKAGERKKRGEVNALEVKIHGSS